MTGMVKSVRPFMLIACLLLCAASALTVAAQDAVEDLNKVALKFDEFGEVHGCDGGARLDNFAVQLENEPAAVGYIISYGPQGEGGGTGQAALSIMTDYLINSRGIAAERLKTIYAGRYKEWKEVATELWIAGPEAAPPEPVRYNTKPEPFTGKFEEFWSWSNLGCCDESTGPSIGPVPRAAFADLLHQQTEMRAVIVAYNAEGAAPGSWRRAAKDVAEGLQNSYKIEAERIETIYAGYWKQKKEKEDEGNQATALVQLWILPKDAPPPVAAAKEAEESPSQAVRIDYLGDWLLADEANTRRAFEGFADVLRSDENLNACVIVRLKKSKATEENAEPAATTPPTDAAPVETAKPAERAMVDLMALVEKWKADLVKDYGISEHRLVVVTGEADESSDGDIETWLVPRGAALPDPNAKEEVVEDGEAVMTYEEIMTEQDTQKEF